MYYNIFIEMKNSDEIKKYLNFESYEEAKKKLDEILADGTVKEDEVQEIKVIETSTVTDGDYTLLKRFIKETGLYGEKFFNEKYPFYYAKDITDEIIKK